MLRFAVIFGGEIEVASFVLLSDAIEFARNKFNRRELYKPYCSIKVFDNEKKETVLTYPEVS